MASERNKIQSTTDSRRPSAGAKPGAEKSSISSLPPGTVISGQFEIIKLLGKGTFGAVYMCMKQRRNGPALLYAIKVMPVKQPVEPLALTRFDAEIELSSQVVHPNVVRTYDTIINYDILAYTMEFVPGGCLSDYLKGPRCLPISYAVHILRQICAGLSAIHCAGIVHHDLKPANVLMTRNMIAKISDFGISSNQAYEQRMQNAKLHGTASFISPERILKGVGDKRSDIFSWGVMAYQLLTGVMPFRGQTPMETIAKRFSTVPPPAYSLRPDCPVYLARIIQKAMAIDPEARFQTAEQVLTALDMCKISQPLVFSTRPVRSSHEDNMHKNDINSKLQASHVAMQELHELDNTIVV